MGEAFKFVNETMNISANFSVPGQRVSCEFTRNAAIKTFEDAFMQGLFMSQVFLWLLALTYVLQIGTYILTYLGYIERGDAVYRDQLQYIRVLRAGFLCILLLKLYVPATQRILVYLMGGA